MRCSVIDLRLGARGSEAHALCLAGDIASTAGADDAEGSYREALTLPVLSADPDAIRFTSYEELRLGAHERISIKRTSAEEGKR